MSSGGEDRADARAHADVAVPTGRHERCRKSGSRAGARIQTNPRRAVLLAKTSTGRALEAQKFYHRSGMEPAETDVVRHPDGDAFCGLSGGGR
jgi:hypothetical protein